LTRPAIAHNHSVSTIMNDSPEPSLKTTLAFILPFVAFLVISQFAPSFSADAEILPDELHPATWYIFLVGLQVVVASCLLIYFSRIYRQHFPLRFTGWSVVVGVVGFFVWVAICECHIERNIYQWTGLESWAETRPAFNPFENIPDQRTRILFLAMRFTLLALLVPILEELFLRGWLVRWFQNPDWESIPLKSIQGWCLLVPSVYGVLTHPAEAVAAFVWFGLVTWLMRKTGNLWDCVIAHAITNLILGLYILQFEAWHLW
jgi:CAAX prenyl protease-like protein